MSGDRYRYYRLSPEEKRALKEAIRSTLEGRGVELAIIFGSFTELESFRDVDVAVYARDSLDLDDAIKLAAELEERTRTPVDVVPLEKASPKLRHHILTKGEVLLEKQPGLYEALLMQTLDELATLEAGNPQPEPPSEQSSPANPPPPPTA
ncbi:MAG: nucleotidyltransferase domain-containing protein [Thermofilum sp.]